MNSQYNPGSGFFRPRARLVSLLGEQLIRDSAVGLIELVKNSHDADASNVELSIEQLQDPSGTTIRLKDDGLGMSPDEVIENWLSPATGNKEIKKNRGERTPRGRQLSGEKGVGRFAVQRLGKQVSLITRQAGHREVEVHINWEDFEDQELYLDEVEVDLKVNARARMFKHDSTGTCLVMKGARAPWTGHELRKVQRALRRLQNPLARINDFQITFSCPERPEYEDIDPSSILDRAHYMFHGTTNERGVMEWTYTCDLPGMDTRENTGTDCLTDLVARELKSKTPSCGAFEVVFHVWDRSRDMMRAIDLTDTELDSYCGVSLYRDDFRVFPYGETGDDWLGLDARRINVPSRRVGNRNIVGLVHITHEKNRRLRDKTNREGLQENRAFEHLKAMVRGALMVFEVERLRDRENTRAQSRPDRALSTTMAVPDDLHNMQVTPPLLTVKKEGVQQSATSHHEDEHDFARASRAILSTRLLHQQQDSLENELHHLAATGLRLDNLGHQFSRHVQHTRKLASDLRSSLDERQKRQFEQLMTSIQIMQNGMRDLVPDGLVCQRESRSSFGLLEVVQDALDLHASMFATGKRQMYLHVPESVTLEGVQRSRIEQVIEQVIHNALTWCDRTTSMEQPVVHVVYSDDTASLLVGDSGPGVTPADRERIFDPYFSRQPDAHGLGLYLARHMFEEQGGSIQLLHPQEPLAMDLPGATFALGFRHMIREEKQS